MTDLIQVYVNNYFSKSKAGLYSLVIQ